MSAAKKNTENEISIFVGTDRSQFFAASVLEYSIRRNTSSPICFVPLTNETANIPKQDDIRHGPRTGFSFVRFAIPALMEYSGRALYLDSDMLVFRDIAELWNWDFDNYHIQIVGETNQTSRTGIIPRKRIRQCSVMLIDCGTCRWNAKEIVGNLGTEYSYEQLMYEMCFLKPEQIGDSLPIVWNSLEIFNNNTCLIHYTDMYLQPWVEPANPNGYLWVNEVKLMLKNSVINDEQVSNEIEKGYIRPSLMEELKLPMQPHPLSKENIINFQKFDRENGFVKHKEFSQVKRDRIKNIRLFENNLSYKELIKAMPTKESSKLISKIKYLLYKLF